MASPDARELGDIAEMRFKSWLDKHDIPYLYISQAPETFSSVFRIEKYGKRPDFMVLLPNFGFIFIDVKNKRLDNFYKNYCIDEKETKTYSSFQRMFNLQVWYVISSEDYDYKTWFWIPVSKVMEMKLRKYTSNLSQQDFFPVPPEEFIQIADSDSIERVFSKRLS